MDRWICRLLDCDDEVVPPVCLVADYLRALRLFGTIDPQLGQAWRNFCVTMGPLASGIQATQQVRVFLSQVEELLGPVPGNFLQVDSEPNRDEAAVRMARRQWADNIMNAVVNTEEEAPPAGGLGEGDANRVEVTVAEPLPEENANQSHESTHVYRKVQVLSAHRELRQCLVKVSEMDSGYAVLSQVASCLAFCGVPPLPRWIYIWDSYDSYGSGEHMIKGTLLRFLWKNTKCLL